MRQPTTNRGGTLVYRCRECDKLEHVVHVPDLSIALVYASSGTPFPQGWGMMTFGLHLTHSCGDGRQGISDLIGGIEDGAEP